MSRQIVIVCDVNGPACWRRSLSAKQETHAEIGARSDGWLLGDPDLGDVCPSCRNQEEYDRG